MDLINNIHGSGWMWFNIIQPTNNNPSPRTILSKNTTYCIYPALQKGIWCVGYAFVMNYNMSGFNDLYFYCCIGISQTRWNTTDEVITTDLENVDKFSKKLLY